MFITIIVLCTYYNRWPLTFLRWREIVFSVQCLAHRTVHVSCNANPLPGHPETIVFVSDARNGPLSCVSDFCLQRATSGQHRCPRTVIYVYSSLSRDITARVFRRVEYGTRQRWLRPFASADRCPAVCAASSEYRVSFGEGTGAVPSAGPSNS